MSKLSEKLVGKPITLICFGEYVGFIHVGDHDHCRIESETVLINSEGFHRAIFPEPDHGVLSSMLGSTVKAVSIGKTIDLILNCGSIIQVNLKHGYESVMLNVGGDSEIY